MSAHPDTQFAVAVASFGQRLQQSPYINDWQYSDSTQLANQSLSYQTVDDANGLRRGFVELIMNFLSPVLLALLTLWIRQAISKRSPSISVNNRLSRANLTVMGSKRAVSIWKSIP